MYDAAFNVLRKSLDSARTALAKAKTDKRHVSYIKTIERNIRELVLAINVLEQNRKDRETLSRAQTLLDLKPRKQT